jgi:hypothetical protein
MGLLKKKEKKPVIFAFPREKKVVGENSRLR